MIKLEKFIYFTLINFLFIGGLTSQENLSYQLPVREILELADAPLPPVIIINSKADYIIFLERSSYQNLEELVQPELGLAGIRINPRLNSRSRLTYYSGATIQKVGSKQVINIEGLPSNVKLGNFSWSPDETHFAVTNTTEHGVELWIVEIEKAKATKLSDSNLNATLGNPYEWAHDGKYLLYLERVNTEEQLINKSKTVPLGPVISTNDGEEAQNRTYQDLLQDKSDEHNFKILGTSTIVKVSLDGEKEVWKDKSMYSDISFSPDGSYVLIREIKEPFSYLVPYSRFPTTYTVFSSSGNLVKLIEEVPLKEVLPKGFMSTITEKRSISWRNDQAATLSFVKALDNGDPENKVDFRDEVFLWIAPFNENPTSLFKTINRYSSITWGDEELALISDYWYNDRNTKTYLINPNNPNKDRQIIFDRNYQDRYNDPGNFVTEKNQFNKYVLVREKNNLFLQGSGYSAEGIKPFISSFNLKDQSTKKQWQAENQEEFVDIARVIDAKKGILLLSRETPSEWPNYHILNFKNKKPLQQVTFLNNPYKSLNDVYKEVLSYQREDGLELSGTLYLPANYDKNSGEKLPLIMWAYPREYKDKSSAGQITSSPFQFTRPYYGSPIYWVTRGYAVLDNAAFPIVGEGETEPNDNFIDQLVSNAKAAIDAIDNLGYIDRQRVAVGGHSYGAFMTANLLSHSDLFAAGIARSGAYNRSLTPFGFQSEQRNYWEAPEIYNTMSPFMTAHKMKTPLLLIHGAADNNSGTYTMQSERYFNALKGLGATVRLVLLPYESHGYRAKESVLHTLWEQDQWLEKYVKNKVLNQ